MSFFTTDKCPYCGKTINTFQKTMIKLENEYLCKECFDKIIINAGVGLLEVNKHSVEEIREIVKKADLEIKKKKDIISAFNMTKNISGKFCYDKPNNQFGVPLNMNFLSNENTEITDMNIYDCSDIISFELLEDGNSISKGGVGRALVGGALFGDVGAIVGGVTGHKQKSTCSKLQIKITMNNVDTPAIYVDLISREVRKDTEIYKKAMNWAQEIISLLEVICQSNNSSQADELKSTNAISEIREFKQLLDEGIITQEEFNVKKKELLGL